MPKFIARPPWSTNHDRPGPQLWCRPVASAMLPPRRGGSIRRPRVSARSSSSGFSRSSRAPWCPRSGDCQPCGPRASCSFRRRCSRPISTLTCSAACRAWRRRRRSTSPPGPGGDPLAAVARGSQRGAGRRWSRGQPGGGAARDPCDDGRSGGVCGVGDGPAGAGLAGAGADGRSVLTSMPSATPAAWPPCSRIPPSSSRRRTCRSSSRGGRPRSGDSWH